MCSPPAVASARAGGRLGTASRDAALSRTVGVFSRQGAKFPWESAATGREVCPEEIYGAQEIHITGDVLMAFEQYYYTTQVKGACAPCTAPWQGLMGIW